MALKGTSYQRLSPGDAARMLRHVRQAYPCHPFQETGFEGVYRRRLPFYRRYLDYLVRFEPAGSWGFYASAEDVVLQDLPGQERAEFVVGRRDPILLDDKTVPSYVHHLCLGSPLYVWDPGSFVFPTDAPEVHRAMVRDYVRQPRLEAVNAEGWYAVSVTLYQQQDEDGNPCSALLETTVQVEPKTGELHPGPWRPVVRNLQAALSSKQ